MTSNFTALKRAPLSKMAAAVEVLCPSGHRQKVKITPNTKILQILEEVCTKKGFLPAEEYELKHGRKSLDVTLNVRFAGLPNHAKLELVKSQKTRAESEVTVALQVESSRVQHPFTPGTTLWEVLQHWEQQPNSEYKDRLTQGRSKDLQAVVTYMREEVIGEFALRETALRTLGLTGGRALLRLSHRQVDQNVIDDIREKIEKEKTRQAKLKAKAQETNQATPVPTTAPHHQAPPPSSDDDPMETDASQTVQSQHSASKAERTTESARPQGEPMDADGSEAATSADQPMEEVVTSGARAAREGRLEERMQERERQEAGLQRLENIPGVQVIRPDDFHDLSQAEQEQARAMAANLFPGLFPAQRSARPKRPPPQVAPPPPAPNPFANFKFPEATKGKDLYRNELSEVKPEEFLPCDRETHLYSLDEEKERIASSNEDIPDEFFDLTLNDVQRMYTDLQNNVKTYGEQPLTTAAMRRQAAEERMARYPRVIIRVQFPDRLVLQAVFRPRETVFALQKFVKGHLADKNSPFYLYTSPPKCILKDNSATLYEANLVPMTVVYFGSETQKDHYLSDATLCEVSPRSVAERIVYSHMAEKSGEGPSTSSDTSRPRPKRTVASSSSKEGGPKVPKWFKVGKK